MVVRLLGAVAHVLRALHADRLQRRARDRIDRALLRAGRPPLRGHVDGVELRGFLRHRSFLADVVAGQFDPYAGEVLLAELHEGTVFVDVGAHLGLYTVLGAPHASRVVAFEADPFSAAALRVNVTRNARNNVRVVAKAASDHAGTASFFLSPGTYGSSLYRRPSMESFERIDIDATTVDAEVGDADDLVLKIDAEGAELDVLAGARTTIFGAQRAVVHIEVNPDALAEAGRSPAELVEALKTLGFDLWRIDQAARELVPLAGDTADWKGNLLGRRAGGTA